MSSNLGFSNHIFFYLIHQQKGIVLIPSPIGWKEGNKTTKRDKNHSTSVQIGSSLEYYGVSLELIKQVRKEYGTDEKLELLCEIRDENSVTKRAIAYRGFLDLSTLEEKDGKGKVKFRKNNLEKILKSAKSQKIELERKDTLVNTPASVLQTKNILIKGRSLFLESKLISAIDPESNANVSLRTPYSFEIKNRRTATGTRTIRTKIAYPFNIQFSSHLEDLTNTPSDSQGGGLIESTSEERYKVGLGAASFFTESDFDRVLDIKFDLKFDIKHLTDDAFNNDTVAVILRKHSLFSESIIDHNDLEEKILFERIYPNVRYEDSIHIKKEFSGNNAIFLKKGDSLSIHIDFKSYLNRNAGNEWSSSRISFKESYITIREDNTTPEKIRKTIRAYDYGKKLVELITGNSEHFYAPILDTGIWKEITLSSGLWVRGFYGEDYGKPEEDISNPNDIQIIKGSLNDFINFCDSKLAVGVSFKVINGIEKICFEPIKDKYQSRVLINLDKQPYSFSRKVKSDMLYTGCKFGDKYADIDSDQELYQEIYGMAEYNTLSEWSTEYYKNEKIYSKISRYRTDATGKTLALKKSIEDYPNTDTRFDQSTFVFHVKDINALLLEERTWQDDFLEPPKNVYAPNDATNLFFTPKQMFLRHSFLFNTEIKKSIKYLSGRGNNTISTINNNNIVVKENTDVNISDILRQVFYAEEISFKYPYDKEIISKINGQTNVNGKEVLNVHGLIRFKNEKGEYEHGFINQVKEDSDIEFKIIATNGLVKKQSTAITPPSDIENLGSFSDVFSDKFN